MKRLTILPVLALALIPACNPMQMTRFEYEDIRLDVGGRLAPGGPAADETATAAAPRKAGDFARLAPPNRQVVIEAKIVEAELNDQAILDIQWWPGFGDPISAINFEDLSPQPIPMTVGFGFGVGGIGGDDPGYYDDDGGSSGVGVGTGVGFPITVGGENGITHVRLTLEVMPTISVDESLLLVLLAVGRQMDGTILTQPMILPLELGSVPAEPDPPLVATQVVVFDGETISLGGLTTEPAEDLTDQVPLLGDLPTLRGLFKSDDRIEHRNLLMFITPKIIIDPGE